MVLLLVIAAAVTVRAQDDDDDEEGGMYDGPPRFHDVKGWRGSLVARVQPSQAGIDIANSLTASGGLMHLEYSGYVRIEFVLDRYEEQPSVWTGKVTSAEIEGYYLNRIENGGVQIISRFQTNGPATVDPDDRVGVQLQFHRERGWSVRFPSIWRMTTVNKRTILPDGKVFSEDQNSRVWAMGNSLTSAYPNKNMVLLQTEKNLRMFNCSSGILGFTPEVEWDYVLGLEPTSMEELRLVIDEPDGYANWRPETTPETEAGSPLSVTARVETANGGTPKISVEKFIWELKNTSKEPGVAMNWPLEAKDKRFDLELDATGSYFKLSDDKQKMERAVQKSFSDSVKVVPYDWGGWSTLQVTAILADGRRLQGKLKGKPEYDLRLPKRSADSHIADGWKREHKDGKDDLDDDKVEGQANNGDGFSLYEEYRGWVVDGQHLEGDPEGKDFFVLNLIGGDAQTGIDLFASVSQLAVHDKLRPEEMSEKTRLMNGNHRQGAHLVDQHGVWIKTFASKSELGGGGAFTTMNKAGVAGRPGLVNGIGILSRSNEDSDFNKPFNLTASDMIFAYDRAIAHELLHSVGVDHHGEGDYNMIVGYCSTRNPFNKLGRPYYGTGMSDPIDLRTEEGEDVAQRDVAEYEKFRQFNDMVLLDRCLKEGEGYIQRNGVGYNGINTPRQYADMQIEILTIFCFMNIKGIVGVERGEHSGTEDCLMRYYFAKFYESKQAPAIGKKQYYLVDKETERIGMEICHDKTGTGVNAPGHKPQPRYGDAANGDCFKAICPNDAVPARSSK